MSTVRVWDALRYASKFFGLLLAVVIVAGGFVAGGAYLAADAISFTDPALSALDETPVFIGVVLLVIGVILGIIGWIALAYKLLGDGVGAAMAARGLGQDRSATDSAGTDDADESTGDAGRRFQAAGTTDDTTTADTSSESSDDQSDGADVSEPGSPPSTTDPTGGPDGESSGPDSTEEFATDSPGRSTADSTPRGAVDEPESAARGAETDAPAGNEPEADEPPEWTPPDPSEFETGASSDGDGGAGADQWADETAGNDAVDEETVGEDSERGTEPSTEAAPEDIEDDATLADEGVESFSAASEEDPLSDRLPSDDDS